MIKVIRLNTKKIGITLVIVGLMVVLIGFGKYINNRLRYAVLMQNDINSLSEFIINNVNYKYKLPSSWETTLKNFNNSEITYHNEFVSEDSKIYGFVQTWNINKSLLNFLKDSKKISQKQNVITNYSINKIDINKQKLYLVKYTLKNKDNILFYAYEYFVPTDNGFIRFSFFVKKQNFKQNMPQIFNAVVSTLESSI